MPPSKVQHQEFEPPAALRDTIKCFWYDRRDYPELPSQFEVMPDGYAEIIFSFGSVSHVADSSQQPLSSPFMVGLLSHPLLFTTQGRLEILGIRCFPWAVFDVFGLLSSRDIVRHLEHPLTQLQTPLEEWVAAGKIEEAVAEIGRYCLDARTRVTLDGMLVTAGAAMHDAHGILPVGRVAASAHATVRTLERRFKHSSGSTVKDVSGLMRFEQVRNRLWLAPRSNLASLAQEVGYADQAHLSREFKRYSGTTPAAFARAKQWEHAERSQ